MRIGDTAVITRDGLDALLSVLAEHGYDVRGPVVHEGAIVPGPVATTDDLPVGRHDTQSPGSYRLEQGDDAELFGWAVGPGSWKADAFPSTQELWRSWVEGGTRVTLTPTGPEGPVAMVGVRPCEIAALGVLDRVLTRGVAPDPRYAARRDGAFVVAAECGSPSSSCFCTSMGTGPQADDGFDLSLCELDGGDFVVRVGTERGGDVLDQLPSSPGTDADLRRRDAVLDGAVGAIGRRLDTDRLPELLARNLEHPRFDEVAERCLACGNCTLVCPTCFCSDVTDTSDLTGAAVRTRQWASCFDLDHSYLHGGPVRTSLPSRYRQWLTHKLSTWWDQFDSSGCVGCGRCITWCPVGIDLTEEVAAIRDDDGARRDRDAPGGTPS
jgi:ferredoxin